MGSAVASLHKALAKKMNILCLLILGFIPWNYADGNYIDGITRSDKFAVAESNFRNLGYSVKFYLYVENYSNQPLTQPQYIEEGGYVFDPPVTVAPGMAEMMTGHKTGWTATGCVGVVSWNIGDTNQMLVVMYDVPWDHTWYSNTIAIGIFPKGDITGFYDKMYYGDTFTIVDKGNGVNRILKDKKFNRWTYDGSWERFEMYSDSRFSARVAMGASYKPGIRIEFFPKKAADQHHEPGKDGCFGGCQKYKKYPLLDWKDTLEKQM